MKFNAVKIAVSDTVYSIDKPYSYLVPENLKDQVAVGKRVIIPFSRSNKKKEGIILKKEYIEDTKGYKNILSIVDDEPILTEKMFNLAFFITRRYYTTFYEAVKTILPTGLWFDLDDRYIFTKKATKIKLEELCKDENLSKIITRISLSGYIKDIDDISLNILLNEGVITLKKKNKIEDKVEKQYFICENITNPLELAYKGISKETRKKIIELLLMKSNISANEIMYATGASRSVINTMVKNQIIDFKEQKVYRDSEVNYNIEKNELLLSKAQAEVFDDILTELETNKYSSNLLYGVTGSGKTQIYIKLLEKCIKSGKNAIVLIPEIALTTQLLSKFTKHFGTDIAILHSGLSLGVRTDEWKKINEGKCKIAIGTRSAIFAPFDNVGLIIIDEEHEKTYKSEKTPRYDAREIAKYRSFQDNAVLLLASATPSLETFYSAKNGQIKLHIIKERYGESKLPDIHIFDMKDMSKKGIDGNIGTLLYTEMEKNLKNMEQTILFLNRRGNSKRFVCLECGHIPECVNCSTNMTFHSANDRIMCHFCGYAYNMPTICPKCSSRHIKTEVFGTQYVEEEVKALFPTATVLRLDADTTTSKNSHQKILSDFEKRKADILIGTQMVTKGLDFENATLVGVIDADQSLFAEDFRSFENTFSQITQVVGRAGRRAKKGRAIIQTYNPENEVILAIQNGDYEEFYKTEIIRRRALKLPPINDFFTFVVSSEDESKATVSAFNLVEKLKVTNKSADLNLIILGPVQAKIFKINKRYRYIITIRTSQNKQKLVSSILKEFSNNKNNKGVSLYADLNGEC